MTVYLDNAATTRVRPEAAEAMLSVITETYGNPSSTHALGREAKAVLDGARRQVAAILGAEPGEIFFTSGGTEADNWAITEGARLRRHQGHHIIISAVEHDAIRRPAAELEQQGWTVTRIAPDSTGHISPEAVAASLTPETVLVSVMLVNNEIGTVNDLAAISRCLGKGRTRPLLHTDAVQAMGKLPISVTKLGVDLMSVSSHKIYGPKGAGALYVKKGLRLPGLIIGGGQENSLRGGTEAMPAVAGFGKAAELARRELAENAAHMQALKAAAAEKLTAIPGLVINGAGEAPHILSVSLPGYRSEVLMSYLDAAGICVSRSSACKKGARSHVLEAMNLPNAVIDGTIRLSFSRDNTPEEIDYLAETLKTACQTLVKAK